MSGQSQQCLFLQLAQGRALELLKSVNFDQQKISAMLLDMQDIETIRKQSSITFGDIVLDTKDLEVFGKLIRENLRILKKPNVNLMDPLRKAVMRVCSTPALDLFDAHLDEHVGSGKSVGVNLRTVYPDLVTLTETSDLTFGDINIKVRRDLMYDGHGASVGYFYYVRVSGRRHVSNSFCGKVSGMYYEEGPIMPVLVGALGLLLVHAKLVNIGLTGQYKKPDQILSLNNPCEEVLRIGIGSRQVDQIFMQDMRLGEILFNEFADYPGISFFESVAHYQKSEEVIKLLDSVRDCNSILRKAILIEGLL